MTAGRLALAFAGSRLLLRTMADRHEIPSEDGLREALGPASFRTAAVDAEVPPVEGREVVLLDLGTEDRDPPPGMTFVGLRDAHALVSEAEFRAAGTGRQKVDWVRDHRFCSRCSTPTRKSDGHESIECPACGLLQFPRLAPAVIVLVQRGREALLGRSHRFKPGVYSTLAGFVEAGESLEECVHREIAEEVGVTVTNLRYFGSQPHPFPHSLMVGFIADWESGEIVMEPEEIEDAGWFTPETLPERPHRMSIARALIDDFVARVLAADRHEGESMKPR